MPQTALLSATLGLVTPWRIISASLDGDKRLSVIIDFDMGTFRCATCGVESEPCFVEKEVWHHDDFHRYSILLHARVPRIHCCCGIVPVERPWSRPGSRFVLVH